MARATIAEKRTATQARKVLARSRRRSPNVGGDVGGQGEAEPRLRRSFTLPEPGFLLSIHVAVEYSRDCRSALAGNDVPDVFGCFHHPGSAGTLQRF